MVNSQSNNSPHPYGAAVSNLIDQFAALPGIGKKTAERLTHHILGCQEREAMKLAHAIKEVKETVKQCEICHGLTESATCGICSDARRDPTVVCIVESPKDITSLEASGAFQGRYHVLHGRISPLDGIGPEDLTINSLVRRIRSGEVKEIVMATNPTLEGDGTALFISNVLENENVTITRLARGIASGSVLEFANKEMLADALRGRQSF